MLISARCPSFFPHGPRSLPLPAGACRAATRATCRRGPPASTLRRTRSRSTRACPASSSTPNWTLGGGGRGCVPTAMSPVGPTMPCQPFPPTRPCTKHPRLLPAPPASRDARDSYLPAFRACVAEAQAASVMCSYNSVNGTPACASHWLLREQLRGCLRFRWAAGRPGRHAASSAQGCLRAWRSRWAITDLGQPPAARRVQRLCCERLRRHRQHYRWGLQGRLGGTAAGSLAGAAACTCRLPPCGSGPPSLACMLACLLRAEHHEWTRSHAQGFAAALRAGTDLACTNYGHIRREAVWVWVAGMWMCKWAGSLPLSQRSLSGA